MARNQSLIAVSFEAVTRGRLPHAVLSRLVADGYELSCVVSSDMSVVEKRVLELSHLKEYFDYFSTAAPDSCATYVQSPESFDYAAILGNVRVGSVRGALPHALILESTANAKTRKE